MSKRVAKLVVAIMVLFSVSAGIAADKVATISRGQTEMWSLSPGDTLTVYYTSDGKPCAVSWWDNWYYYQQFKPFTAMTVFASSNNACYWLRNAAVQWVPQSSSWMFPKGWRYVFVIKNYTNGDFVYLRIR